jgi:iron-sulfur cluster repair protein YtfE (RIC family)
MGTLAEALELEHREIDAGIERFVDGSGRADSLTRAGAALRRHIYLEEEFLFPPLRDAGLMAPVFVMVREHGQMWRTLDGLDGQLAGGVADPAVRDACAELVAQLQAHNPKEEQILYPQADAVLGAEAGGQLAAFLESGAMPEGWVCEGARG